MKKYLLIPGYVDSATDNDVHYISATQLARLYNVPMHECVVYGAEQSRGIDIKALTALTVQYSGNYKIKRK